jgi:hypothetical protein
MSGLSRTPGKRVWVYPHRGFESRLLRQITRFHAVFKAFCPCSPHETRQSPNRLKQSQESPSDGAFFCLCLCLWWYEIQVGGTQGAMKSTAGVF